MPLTLSAQRPAFGAARHATGTASSQRGRAQAAVSAGPRMQATGVLGTRRKPERLVVRSLPSDGAALVSTPGPEQEAAQHGHSHEHDEDDHGHSHSHGHSHGGANAKHGHSHDAHEDGEAQLIAGIHSHSHSRRHDGEGNVAQRGLTAVFSFLGVTELAALLQDSISVVVTAWVLLVVVGLASLTSSLGLVQAAFASQVSAVATAVIYILIGTPALVDVCYELAAFNINIHVLTTAAVFGTVVLGCAAEGALLLLLFSSAHFIEQRLTAHAQGDLRALWATVPKVAQLVTLNRDGSPDLNSVRGVACDTVPVGSLTIVKGGETIPIDGEIVHGSAFVSLEHLTGESLPLSKVPGDEVPAGALDNDGLLVIRTTRTSADSTPARIAKLTAAAQSRRPNVQRLIDKIGDRYSAAVLGASLLFMAVGPMLGLQLLGPGGAAYRAMGFLSAAAPCAVVMAPLAYVAAIGTCAQRGALVRGGLTIDALADVGCIALDKTGTLTTGVLRLNSIERLCDGQLATSALGAKGSPPSEPRAFAVALALAQRSLHPVSRAIVASAGELDPGALPVVSVDGFRVVHGSGVEGTVTLAGDSRPMFARFGSVNFVAELCQPADAEGLRARAVAGNRTDVLSAMYLQGGGAVVLSGNGTGACADDLTLFTFSDTVRERSAAAIQALREAVWQAPGRAPPKILMLTGDNDASARSIASRLGIPQESVFSGLSPSDKMNMIGKLRRDLELPSWTGGRSVIMVGDGINDAPALAAADVGIAITSTTNEAAGGAADVLLLHKGGIGVALLPELVATAVRTRRIVRQNIAIAVISIAAAALPAIAGFFPLWLAVLLHEGSTVAVALNSMRLVLVPSMAVLRPLLIPALKGVAKWALIAAAAAAAVAGVEAAVQRFSTVAATATGPLKALIMSLESGAAGLAAGILHTLAGPDHLAALTPLTIGRSRFQGALMGGLWGAGHNTGQIIFALVFLLLRDRLPFNLEAIESGGKALVGATLLLIGILGYREAMVDSGHAHSHSHSHSHGGEEGEGTGMKRRFSVATFATGLVHGLQPDALLVIIPTLALPKIAAISYLFTYMFGTVIAMASYTAFIGAGTARLSRRSPGMTRRISLLSAMLAVVIGILIEVSIFFPEMVPFL